MHRGSGGLIAIAICSFSKVKHNMNGWQGGEMGYPVHERTWGVRHGSLVGDGVKNDHMGNP